MRAKLTAIVTLVLLVAFLTAGAGQAAPDTVGGAVHVVQWGENLASIALRYGTTVAALCQANGLANPNMIYIGQRLVVPGSGEMPPLLQQGVPQAYQQGVPQQGEAYTVRYGDTLTSIALRNKTSVQALMAANNLPGGSIYAGQQLIVPGAPQAAMGPMAAQPLQAQAGLPTEVVKPGDTLSALAYRYGTTVNDIMQANSLYNPWIYSGQTLVMPGRAAGPAGQAMEMPAGTNHVVATGETLAGIALRYGTTVQAILQANGLAQSDYIMAGQSLVVPGMMRNSPEAAAPGMAAPSPMIAQGANPSRPTTARTGQNVAPFTDNAAGQDGSGLLIGPAVPPAGAQQLAAGQLPRSSNLATGQGLMESQPQGYNTGGGQAPMTSQGYDFTGGQGSLGPQGYGVPPLVDGQVPVLAVGPNPAQSPAITLKWVGRLVSMVQPEDEMYPGVLRVQAGGNGGMAITVSKVPGSWSTTGYTGNKPEYGNGTAEFAPIGSGYHTICLDGQNACMRINIAPHSLTYVEFDQVPNG